MWVEVHTKINCPNSGACADIEAIVDFTDGRFVESTLHGHLEEMVLEVCSLA